MIKYPIAFEARASSGSDLQNSWTVSAGERENLCAIPPEFEGPGGAMSPEDFFLLAISNCFVATFKVYASASKLKFETIKLNSRLVIELNEERQPFAKECWLTVEVSAASNGERALSLLNKVARSGILLNSVKTELHYQFKLS